ncbi:MAG: non-canonical purine NTP pyrophosphatase [Patescibacteria group bacterium]
MDIILSTRNPSKALQIQEIFEGSGLRVRTLEEAGIEGEAVENGETLEENAAKKAWYAHEHAPGLWTMADETGLFITALDGAPGIRAASWAGDVSTDEIMQYCLKRLGGAKDRSAIFRTVVVLVSPEGQEHPFTGEVAGTLLEAPRAKPQPKMPYSPLFVPDGETLTWAQMNIDHENRISQRGIAFRKVLKFLTQ